MQDVDKDWLERTLKEWGQTWRLREIIDVEGANAVGEGNNYVGDLLRLRVKFVNLEGGRDEISLIYKFLPKFGNVLPMERVAQLFENEVRVYTKVLKKIGEFIKMKDPESDIYWPNFYGVKGKNEGCLMEDLSVDGFKMVDRRQELDIDHIKICLEALAKYHAAGAVLLEKGVIEKHLIDETRIFFAVNEDVDYFLRRAFKALVKVIEENWSSEWQEYAGKLRKLESTLKARLLHALDNEVYSFLTLNHGDVWSNNILFKYDEGGSLIKVKFVDYQLPFINSPCHELHYFFSSNMKLESLDERNDLLRIYHKSLSHFLQIFEYGGTVPTFDQLLQDFDKSKICGLLTTVMLKAYFLNPSYLELAREQNVTDEFRYELPLYYHCDYYWKILQAALKTMDECGYLNEHFQK